MDLIDKINSPKDIKNLSFEELERLCAQIRAFLIDNISKTGGHLASNLGVVELTVALHKVFNAPSDSIVWDVGHQTYVHKILTGRKDKFDTLRQLNGISGFTNPKESPYDEFLTGHSSTSVSAALGIAKANALLKNDFKSIAIIGDGALTGGMAFEALNNAGRSEENIIVILNDNEMSISRNVGGMAKYLSKLRSAPVYFAIKDKTYNLLKKVPLIGKGIVKLIIAWKTALKDILYHSTMFEEMGFVYLGPADGHNLKNLCELLVRASTINKPVLLHINTVKGKGYTYAEENPTDYHGISKFDKVNGVSSLNGNIDFSGIFGEKLCELAEKDEKICAVTAAMTTGTGLKSFEDKFKNRFFDVGIAEQHAVTFSAGLAKKGFIPVFSVYSSFLQRAYDQLLNDVYLQNLKVVLAIDRAGITGEDGETHQGIYDTAFLNTIPKIKIFSPSNYNELREMLNNAVYETDGLSAVRYPKGAQDIDAENSGYDGSIYKLIKTPSSKILIITYGRLYYNAVRAVSILKEKGIVADILKLNIIKPIEKSVKDIISKYDKIVFFEEGIENGGIGETVGAIAANLDKKYYLKGIKGAVQHGSVQELLFICGLDEKSMADFVRGVQSD